ncbi:transporter substrate-binding domain-containing protein [Mesorhizobium sp. M4B.F.Ca.ET.143.01.1.1]
MRMSLAITISVASLLAALPTRAESERTISIATEGASPPWDGTGADGKLYGYDVDVGLELCNRIKIKCTFVAQDWDGIIPALLVGKYDVIMSGMAITEKRKQQIAFSSPYASGYNQFVVRKELGLDTGDTKAKVNLQGWRQREGNHRPAQIDPQRQNDWCPSFIELRGCCEATPRRCRDHSQL